MLASGDFNCCEGVVAVNLNRNKKGVVKTTQTVDKGL